MNCFRYTKTLNDYFPSAILGNGLFTAIAKEHWYPDISPAAFDTYFCLMAGEKLGAKVLEKFTDDEGEITGNNLNKLAKIILNINMNSWDHVYKTLTVEYNPIENTDYVETIKDKTGNVRTLDTENVTDGTNAGNVFGFDSSTAVGDNSTDIDNTVTDSGTISDEGSYEREFRRHGNIGVTTNAQMISSDLLVWQNKFADIMISDICDIIALSIY